MTRTNLGIEWLLLVAGLCGFGLLQPACGGGETSGTGGSGPASSSSSSSTGGTGGTGGMEPETGGGGNTLIDCPPGGNQPTTIPQGDCNILQQTCPIGYGCEPVNVAGQWTTNCVPGNGLKEAGNACVSDAECKPGLQCVFEKCSPVCCPNNDLPCEGGLCNTTDTQSVPGHTTYYCSYLPTCTLFDPGACNGGVDGNCYPNTGSAFCVPPVPPISGAGEPCQNLNNCESNQLCVNTTNTCQWACYLDMSSTTPGAGGCPAGENCTDVGFGIPNIGICLAP